MVSTSEHGCSTILVIEDEEGIREAIEALLDMEGYRVVTAKDGKAGMVALKTLERPCLILLDLMMPIMNGWEFLDVLRDEPNVSFAALPVVITTAAGNEALEAAKKAQGLIRKPIDFDLLVETVRKYCGAPSPK